MTESIDWKAIQQALAWEGYDPGPIDGVKGRLTIKALREMQFDHGLTVDGIAGPNTMAALYGFDEMAGETMPWFDEARRLLGLQEDARRGRSNPDVVALADPLSVDYDSDDIPWCGLFVGHCVATTLPEEPLPENLLWSRGWLEFGEEVEPQRGSILVFWRGSPDGWKGHVGLYAREDRETFEVLGGNQSNSVSLIRIAKSRLLGARWPLTGPEPTGEKVRADLGGPLSTDEA